jgi:hypothetical protein
MPLCTTAAVYDWYESGISTSTSAPIIKTFDKYNKNILHDSYCINFATDGTSTRGFYNDWATHNKWGDNYTYNWQHSFEPPLSVSDRFRQILQRRQGPAIISSRTPAKIASDVRELRARETLHRLLGDDKFRRFLRNGFVSVCGKSGKMYQIYPGHGMTIVYDQGIPVEKLCVVLRGDFTPTDSLITRYVMILHDELHFRGLANVWRATPRIAQQQNIDTRPLLQIFNSLKSAA